MEPMRVRFLIVVNPRSRVRVSSGILGVPVLSLVRVLPFWGSSLAAPLIRKVPMVTRNVNFGRE